MAFTEFKNSGQVLRQYDIRAQRKNFIHFSKTYPTPARLIEDIEFTLNYVNYDVSEFSICESIIYPILLQVWKPFLDIFALHSHRTWQVNDALTGIPDYLISVISKYGESIVGIPVFFAIEAKKDNFEEGWGQCVAEMVAAQLVNPDKDLTVYGVVTNGKLWEFAQLQGKIFTKNKDYIAVTELDKLYAALLFLLEDCQNQLKNLQL